MCICVYVYVCSYLEHLDEVIGAGFVRMVATSLEYLLERFQPRKTISSAAKKPLLEVVMSLVRISHVDEKADHDVFLFVAVVLRR